MRYEHKSFAILVYLLELAGKLDEHIPPHINNRTVDWNTHHMFTANIAIEVYIGE
jgi:hypothetical protein